MICQYFINKIQQEKINTSLVCRTGGLKRFTFCFWAFGSIFSKPKCCKKKNQTSAPLLKNDFTESAGNCDDEKKVSEFGKTAGHKTHTAKRQIMLDLQREEAIISRSVSMRDKPV